MDTELLHLRIKQLPPILTKTSMTLVSSTGEEIWSMNVPLTCYICKNQKERCTIQLYIFLILFCTVP